MWGCVLTLLIYLHLSNFLNTSRWRDSFPHCIFLPPLLKIDHRCEDLFPGSLLFFVPIPCHFDYLSFVVLLLTALEKAKQCTWAAFKLPWDLGQCSFYRITLHFEEFERVSSLWKSSKQIYSPWDVQGEKFVISLDTNSCVTWDKSADLLQFLHL